MSRLPANRREVPVNLLELRIREARAAAAAFQRAMERVSEAVDLEDEELEAMRRNILAGGDGKTIITGRVQSPPGRGIVDAHGNIVRE